MTNLEKWNYYLKDLESPQSYIDWGFYYLISSALQRKVWLYPEGFELYPNMYVFLIGPPATGKGRVITQVSNIIKSPQLTIVDKQGNVVPIMPYGADTITQEAFIRQLSTCSRSHEYFIPQPDGSKKRNVYVHSSVTFMIEELGVLLRKNTENVVNMLIQCYDAHNYHYMTKHQGEDDVRNVCVSILAGTTPDFIRQCFSDAIISQGFTSRTMLIHEEHPRFRRQFPGVTPDQIKAKEEIVQHVKQLKNLIGEVKLSPEAQEYHKLWYESEKILTARVNNDSRLDHYYSRKNSMWLKLAMSMHFADQCTSMEIQLPTLQRAFATITEREPQMHKAFAVSCKNPLAETISLIHGYIRTESKSGGVTFKRLWMEFIRDADRTTLEGCLNYLTTTQQVKMNGERYVAIEKDTTSEQVLV